MATTADVLPMKNKLDPRLDNSLISYITVTRTAFFESICLIARRCQLTTPHFYLKALIHCIEIILNVA